MSTEQAEYQLQAPEEQPPDPAVAVAEAAAAAAAAAVAASTADQENAAADDSVAAPIETEETPALVVAEAPLAEAPVPSPSVPSPVAIARPAAAETESAPAQAAPAPANVIWTLVPTVVFPDGTSAPATSLPAGFPVPGMPNGGQTVFTIQQQPAASFSETGVKTDECEEGQPAHQPQQVMLQFQAPVGGKQGQAYIVAPPGFAPGQNFTISLPHQATNLPQARVSNDPNHPLFTLDLSDDNTDLPLPLEDEVDLSTYPYKINLGKDVVSGKGGKVQQLNRHFRNMVAAAYPTYDSTSSKISKRKIGLKIYQAIIDRGGRFLDPDGNPMDRPKSILKVMKALKDAKTWTSDAKRMAKRKREENKSKGGLTEGEREANRETKRMIIAASQNMQDQMNVEPVLAPIAVATNFDSKPPIEETTGPGYPSILLQTRVLPTQNQKMARDDALDGTSVELKVEDLKRIADDTIQGVEPVDVMGTHNPDAQALKDDMHDDAGTADAAAAVDAAMADIPNDVGLEEAAAAAAAAVSAADEAEGGQESSALGLQLLTKAAADADDNNPDISMDSMDV